jgi:hypothetical protein
MTLRVLLSLVFAGAAFFGVIVFAALGMPFTAIFSGVAVPLFLLVASRESDAAREDADWTEARRHPRL